jgi:hypothetical protein
MSKEILEDILGKPMFKELWTSDCQLVLPVVPQDFALPATLAPVLYMLRWNRRRGQGHFVSKFGNPKSRLLRDQAATSKKVADNLLNADHGYVQGWGHPLEKNVLADLLLAYCFDNKGKSQERDSPIQRVYPTHYFASWIDLPVQVANLRNVPEFIVGTLRLGIRKTENKGSGLVQSFERNPLIKVLGGGLHVSGESITRESDLFDERHPVGIDQLLTIRVAQHLELAPNPQAGSCVPQFAIPAARAHWQWYEDLNVFLRAYGHRVPRLSLIPMLETGLSVGLTSVFLATIEILRNWEHTGFVLPEHIQGHWPVFVDCSAGADLELRRIAEESMAGTVRQLQRVSVQFMVIKILMYQARSTRVAGFTREDNPHQNPVDSLGALGGLLLGTHERSQRIFDSLEEKCFQIAERLAENGDTSHVRLLEESGRHPAWRLGEYMVSTMGGKLQYEQLRKFLDSCMVTNAPNGLAVRRNTRQDQQSVEQRSITLSNTTLDYLVHRHLRRDKKGTPERTLSVRDFVDILQQRYGLYIASVPRNVDVPTDLLRRNRMFLERRLRDLGLLAGVNDAEAMKRLIPRYGQVDPKESEPEALNETGD